MSRENLNRWLELEGHDRDQEAEIALFELFGSLPAPVPSADFCQRVLHQAGIVPPRDLKGWSRYLTMAALLLTAIATACTAPLLLGMLLTVDLSAAIRVAAEAVAGTAQFLVELWTLGSAFGSFGRALWVAAASPQALTALALTMTFVLIVSRCLIALISSQRNHTHVSI